MARRTAFNVFLVALLVGGASGATVTPIAKVLQMMNDLVAKQMKEKNAEAKAFDKFKTWCHETNRDKGFEVEDGVKTMDSLSADIEKHTTDATVLGQDIAQLDQELDEAEAELSAASSRRDNKRSDYQATHADYTGSLASLASGLTNLKKMMNADGGAAASAAASSLVQNIAAQPALPEFAQKALTSFLSDSAEGPGDFKQPEAVAFESQSGGVLGMMQDLEAKMKDEKIELENREMNEQHAFDMLAADLKDQIKNDQSSRASKASAMKQSESLAAQAKGDLAEATRVHGEDEKYVKDLNALCHQKSEDFSTREKMREEELDALNNAMEIIGSGEVAGAGAAHLPGLVQNQKKASSLGQLRSSALRHPSSAQAAVGSFLAAQAGKLGSRQLSLLAARVNADPFVKVRTMIEAMIAKLQDEASEEADHKGWCDEELSTNEQTRTAKTTKVAELEANIEAMTAASQKLANDIKDLAKSVAELDAAVAEATETRQAEKAKNTETIADAQAAIFAVQKATTVLKEFYTKAAGATALVQFTKKSEQSPADDAPDTFGEPFKGNSGGNGAGGILSMMEIILSDFQRLEAETDTAEAIAAEEYKTFVADSAKDREAKEEERKAKGSRVSKTNHDIRLTKKDLKSTQEELTAAMKYFNELKPSCVDDGISYEDRVAARKAEIASLQDALKMLLDGTPA